MREGKLPLEKKFPKINWCSQKLKLFLPRGSLTLVSIHGESRMNTYQGGWNRLREK